MRFACLIGNGLSLSFNEELSVPKLTEWLLGAFRQEGGTLEALARFAQSAGTPAETFEQLLGPLDRTARSLPHLEGLLQVATEFDRPDLRTALSELATFASRLHDLGLGVVLQRISDMGAAVETPEFERTVLPVCASLKALPGGSVAVATLNYDALLPAAFIRLDDVDPWSGTAREMSDLGDGRSPSHCEPVDDERIDTYELRARSDLLPRKIMLLNLHGSLSWLHETRTGRMHKAAALGKLRDIGYWDYLKRGNAQCRPLVVLTDQKADVVSDPPFSVAYDGFQEALVAADHWLIAGYGLGDRPVNVALLQAVESLRRIAARKGVDPRLPQVLVIDKDCIVDEKRQEVCQLLRLPFENVMIEPAGLPDAISQDTWVAWSTL